MRELTKNLGMLILVWYVFGCSDQTNSLLQVRNSWVREPPGRHAISGAYMELINTSSTTCEILRISSEQVGRVEIHKMEDDNGTMRMRKVDSLILRSGERCNLQPGGLHLMLMEISDVLKVGDTLSLMFHFSDGTKQLVESMVRKGPYE